MKLRMKQDIEGAPDHINVYFYQSGQVYDRSTTPPLSADLEEIFLAEGWAEEVKDGLFSRKSTAQPSAPAPERDTSPRRPEPKEFTISLDPHFFR